MVKFQARWMKKRYKPNREYRHKHYVLGFPTRLNEKIEPHEKKDFRSEAFSHAEKGVRETINMILARELDHAYNDVRVRIWSLWKTFKTQ